VILGVVVANGSGGDPQSGNGGMEAEYHLIDLATGLAHRGFRSLVAARQEAQVAWEIFRGGMRVERHDPRV
jgi:hypothetical protein